MNVPGYIAINRDFAHTVLPDRVLIQRPGGVPIVNEYGVLVPGQTTNVSFNGSDLIPCRFDTSRAFRPDGLREQEAVVNEYIAHFHRGVDVRPDDRIVLLEPIEVTANGRFLGGLSGWGGAVTGLTYQEFKPPGVKLITADDTTQLLTQTLAITLGQRVLVSVWAEVSDGTVVFHTPIGDFELEGSVKFEAAGFAESNQVFFTGVLPQAAAHITEVRVYQYRASRIFEARKMSNASVYDVTQEILVAEMEFQHTKDG